MSRVSLSKHSLVGSSAEALETLGANLLAAIKRRRLKRRDVAERAFISEPTLRAVLRGDPTVSMAAYVSVLAVLGLDDDLARVADPKHDEVGQALELRNLPSRVRTRDSQYDF